MRTRAALLTLALALAAALGGAGCGPPYAVIRRTVPNPFLGRAARFTVEPMRFEGVMVGSEPEAYYLSHRDAQQQASYVADRRAMAEHFLERLAAEMPGRVMIGTAPDPETYVIRANAVFMEPGVYAYVFNRATEVRIMVQILNFQGVLVDEITTIARVPATLTNPSSGGRFRTAAEYLADHVARYLRDRAEGRARNHTVRGPRAG